MQQQRTHPHNTSRLLRVAGPALLSFLLFGACVELVTNVDFPDQEPKVVVYGFLSPSDTAVMVMLTWSVPISRGAREREPEFIADGEVRIKNRNGEEARLSYCPDRMIYRLPTAAFGVSEGMDYFLEVDVPGQDLISASCHVPLANRSLRVERTDTFPGQWSDRIVVEYGFEDFPEPGQRFYAPSAWRLTWSEPDGNHLLPKNRLKMENIYGGTYVTNKDREGQSFLFRAETYIYSDDVMPSDPDLLPPAGAIQLLLLSTDEHYYRFHRDMENYQPDNFFSEAIHVYSNIRGGKGVFAGLSRTELIIGE